MKLIKLNTDHYVIVDDSEIKVGDWCLMFDDFGNLFLGNQPQQYLGEQEGHYLNKGLKKITHSTIPKGMMLMEGIKRLSLQEVKELIGEVDVEKHWEYFRIKNPNTVGGFKEQYISFLYGYNQALEDNKEKKYTEEDMKNALFYALNHPKEDGVISITRDSIVRKSIQSLQPKTEWEVEFIDGKLKLK